MLRTRVCAHPPSSGGGCPEEASEGTAFVASTAFPSGRAQSLPEQANYPFQLKYLLPIATARLSHALALSQHEARLEAQVLAAHALGVNRAWLVAHDTDTLTPAQTAAIEALVARREGGEPVAYILGEREFYGRLFKVTPDILIPRPETELLVEAVLERLPKGKPAQVLDLGTGSGCIAISLALERPLSQITAVDASPAALAIAKENALCLGAANIEFIQSEWYTALDAQKFDIIVSNPPYIPEDDPHLTRGDLRFEPLTALASGSDGLDACRRIVEGAAEYLEAGGWLLLEHGYDQSGESLLALAGYRATFTVTDLAGKPRISGGSKS